MTAPFREALYRRYVSGHQGILDASRRDPTLTRDVIARLPADRAASILDIGCGQGDMVALVRSYGWTEVVGVDISEEQVSAAAARGVPGVVHGDLFEHARVHPGTYDVVLAVDVVEHFDRDQALGVFESLRAMLKPGGCVIIQTPNGASPFSGRIFWSDVTHGMQYTNRSLAQICDAAGFAEVRSFPQRPAVHGFTSLVRAVVWRAIESTIWLAAAAETGRTRQHVLTQNLVAVARNPG
jgi:2-polyprenyl-3-methyl-5-hydroxy-6-metoxy-1,4-benzoquinol methylase